MLHVDTDKVNCVTKADAVYEIARSAAENQSEGYHSQDGGRREVMKKHQDSDDTGYAEADEKLAVVLKQAKNGTSILNINQVQKSGQQLHLGSIDGDPELA